MTAKEGPGCTVSPPALQKNRGAPGRYTVSVRVHVCFVCLPAFGWAGHWFADLCLDCSTCAEHFCGSFVMWRWFCARVCVCACVFVRPACARACVFVGRCVCVRCMCGLIALFLVARMWLLDADVIVHVASESMAEGSPSTSRRLRRLGLKPRDLNGV